MNSKATITREDIILRLWDVWEGVSQIRHPIRNEEGRPMDDVRMRIESACDAMDRVLLDTARELRRGVKPSPNDPE